MSINLGTSTLVVTSQERTWRINIESAQGADPVITVYREVVKTAPDGTIISKEQSGMVERSLAAVASQTFRIGGHEYTTAEVAGVIATVADLWRQEDIAAQEKASEQQKATEQ